MKHIVILSGAGMSAESGVKTFRDHDGLWEGHDVMEVASPEGFSSNPKLVFEFYNQRRRQLQSVIPNSAHLAIAALEKKFNVTVITQNVDDLHERAGSSRVIHLHGELLKARSTHDPTEIIPWTGDLNLGDRCKKGHQLRPHIVWFGEAVPLFDKAVHECSTADIVLVIGTSLQVYPAAGLMHYAPNSAKLFYIDPNPSIASDFRVTVIAEKATVGIKVFVKRLKDLVP